MGGREGAFKEGSRNGKLRIKGKRIPRRFEAIFDSILSHCRTQFWLPFQPLQRSVWREPPLDFFLFIFLFFLGFEQHVSGGGPGPRLADSGGARLFFLRFLFFANFVHGGDPLLTLTYVLLYYFIYLWFSTEYINLLLFFFTYSLRPILLILLKYFINFIRVFIN